MTNKRFFTQKGANRPLETHQAIEKNNRLAKLHRRFAHLSYCEKNRAWKEFAYWLGLLICVVSIASSFFGAYSLLRFVVPEPTLAGIISLALLIALIYAQRKSSDRFWDTFYRDGKIEIRWLLLSLFVLLLNMASGGFGAFSVIQHNTPPPVQQEDEILAELKAEKDSVDQNIAKMEKTTWHGTVTRKATAAIKEYSATQKMLMAAIISRTGQAESDHKDEVQEHTELIAWIIKYTILLYLLLELLHELCIRYVSYYDFRELCEMAGSHENLMRVLHLDPEEVKALNALNVAAERQQQIGFQIPSEGFNPSSEPPSGPTMQADSTPLNALNDQIAESAERLEIQSVQPEHVPLNVSERSEVIQRVTETIDLTKLKQDLRNGWRRMHKPLPKLEEVGVEVYQKSLKGIQDNTELYHKTAKELKELGISWTTYEDGRLSFD